MPMEKENQQKAFELYYALGEQRTYKQVAEQLGVSPSTVKHWSRSFGWRGRIRERDADVARKVADQALQSTVQERERNAKIVHLALMRLAKAIAEGKVRMQLGDLERLIRLQAFLADGREPEIDEPPPRTIAEFEERKARIEKLPGMQRMNQLMRSVPDEILDECIHNILAKVNESGPLFSPAKKKDAP